MKTRTLPKLQEWDQFDDYVLSLQRLGWIPTQRADGPDGRSWTFHRKGDTLWLVFDDMLGGSLRTEDPAVNLEAVAAELEA